MGCQVFLPDRSVSRQHAVIYTARDGSWVVEDLESTNKTFLNDVAIFKTPLKHGDIVNIGSFRVEVTLDKDKIESAVDKSAIHLDDTLAEISEEIVTEVRRANSLKGHPIEMPIKRAEDFFRASRSIRQARNLKELHRGLLDTIFSQFTPHFAWVALRREAEGPMEVEGGREITTKAIVKSELPAYAQIKEAQAKGKYILVPELPKGNHAKSAIIAPIMRGSGCYGYLFASNSTDHANYILGDLDYLMFISINVAVGLGNI
jgi:predicted component of type VI protein secretion system